MSSRGRYLSFWAWVACRTSWLMHRLLCAPYDSATEPDARLSSCTATAQISTSSTVLLRRNRQNADDNIE